MHRDLLAVGCSLLASVTGCSSPTNQAASSASAASPPPSATASASSANATGIELRFRAIALPKTATSVTAYLIDGGPIATVLQAHAYDFQHCFGAGGETNGSDAWAIAKIDTTGKIVGARQAHPSAPAEASTCVVHALEGIAFEPGAAPIALAVWARPSATDAKTTPENAACEVDRVESYSERCKSAPGVAARDAARMGIGLSLDGIGGPKLARANTPKLKAGPINAIGRLPPEVIQRIVRQNFGRFRQCYVHATEKNPSLEGTVSVHFTITEDGSVSDAREEGSSLPDPAVRACVARAFTGLSFPQPEGGKVKVVYPIAFSPGSGAPSHSEISASASAEPSASPLPSASASASTALAVTIDGAPLDRVVAANVVDKLSKRGIPSAAVEDDPSGAVPFVVFAVLGNERVAIVRAPPPDTATPLDPRLFAVTTNGAAIVVTQNGVPIDDAVKLALIDN